MTIAHHDTSDERFQLALMAGNAGTWDLDLVTGRNVWSESHFTLLGYEPTADRVAPESMWRDAIIDEDLPRVLERWTEAQKKRELFRSEHRLRRKGGEILWVYAVGRFFWNDAGQAIRFLGVFYDISAHKRTEAQLSDTARRLEDERRRLSLALRAGHLGVYEWRIADDSLWWSPETYVLFGVDPLTFPLRRTAFEALVHPDDREELWRKSDECIAERKVFTHTYRIVRPDGEVRWIYNQSDLVVDATGVVGVTGVAVDVTERKQLEAVLLASDRRKDEFLATLAHELRNPLAPLRSGIELLASADTDHNSIVPMLKRQVDALSRLVDDLVDVARLSTGKTALRPEPRQLADLVAAAVETSKPLIERAGHTLDVRVEPTPCWLNVDPVRVTQVLSNVLNNAVKFTPRGGHIAIDARVEASLAVIRVSDSGVGIATDDLSAIFELFAQAGDVRQGKGLGIGLAVAKRFVEAHGGNIRARSAGVGRGSTFEISLPTVAAPVVVAKQSAKAKTPPRRILVVDDNTDAAESLAKVLERQGHAMRVASDGHRALSDYQAFQPDIILLDLCMPGLDGFTVAEQIRAHPARVPPRIVALSGLGAPHDLQRTNAAGFDAHLTKPVSIEALSEVITSLCGGHREGLL